jgi:hypothetical protein
MSAARTARCAALQSPVRDFISMVISFLLYMIQLSCQAGPHATPLTHQAACRRNPRRGQTLTRTRRQGPSIVEEATLQEGPQRRSGREIPPSDMTGVDVNLPLQIATLDASIGRTADITAPNICTA